MSNLTTKAMLVKLSIAIPAMKKYDKKATAEVAQAHGTATTVGRYNKSLLGQDAPVYKALQQCANAARTTHYEQTLPWSNDEHRILPSTNYLEYSQRMRTHNHNTDNAAQDFFADYPALVTQAQRLLNGLYNPADYPSVADLRHKYSFSVKYSPLPDASDFRVELLDDDVQAIRDSITRDVNESVQGAVTNLYERMHAHVSRMAERLGDEDAVFRDSLVLNIRELCDILPRLNLTGDANLDAMAQRINAELGMFEPDELRESKALRSEIARKALQAQSDLATFMGI